MRISVVIPTYNSAAFIHATLDSVLQQTLSPDEILVLDDGSTDNTVSLLNNYKPTITVFQQDNRGVASSRNTLCKRAKGDLIAFLDHDDLWHPNYLEIQKRHFQMYPNAVAFFTGHINFYGYGKYNWDNIKFYKEPNIILMDPLFFLKKYNTDTGLFSSASFFCVPKRILSKIGDKPFCEKVSGVDDGYLCNLFPLLGPVVYTPAPLVAYRIIKEGQSTNKLKAFGQNVDIFEILDEHYRNFKDKRFYQAFRTVFALKRRTYAKYLMGAGKTSEARRQLIYSLKNTINFISLGKSLILLLFTFMPEFLQPKWPSSNRTLRDVDLRRKKVRI